jgi:hypothetical protein
MVRPVAGEPAFARQYTASPSIDIASAKTKVTFETTVNSRVAIQMLGKKMHTDKIADLSHALRTALILADDCQLTTVGLRIAETIDLLPTDINPPACVHMDEFRHKPD